MGVLGQEDSMASVKRVNSSRTYEIEFVHRGTTYNVTYVLDLERTGISKFMTIPPVTAYIDHGKMAQAVFERCGVRPRSKLFAEVEEALIMEVPKAIEF